MLVQAAPLEPNLAAGKLLQVLADSFRTGVDAIRAQLDRPVLDEQSLDFVPQRAVEVVAIGALQMLHRARGFQALHLGGELRHLAIECRFGRERDIPACGQCQQ